MRRSSLLPSITRIPLLTITPLRSTTAHGLRIGSGAGNGPDTGAGRSEPTRERFEEDVLIFTHSVQKERRSIIRPKLLQQYPKGSPQREIGLEPPKSSVLQLEDRAHHLLKLIRLRLGKALQQDASEHCVRVLHRSARKCTDFVTPTQESKNLSRQAFLEGRHTVRHSHPQGSSISDFTTSMTRATVEDSTAGRQTTACHPHARVDAV